MHIGILTGGGDCPGLNAVIRAVTLALINECGARVTGIERGFLGLLTRSVRPLGLREVQGILAQGGTILGTHNRCDPFHYFGADGADCSAQALAFARELGLDGLVVIGGDGTMSIAHRFEPLGLPVVGVPKTIDNDLAHTDRTFGFDSAVAVVAEALDRLETTARSHGRVMIAETMGRYAGWIALEGGMAGGADMILLPELPFSVEAVARLCAEREAGDGCTLICIAEGARAAGRELTVRATLADSPDPIRLGGVGQWLQQQLQPLLSSEVRTTLLGHVQRGGSPTPYDRVLATRFGYHAAQLVRRGEWGRMVTLHGEDCASVPLSEVAGKSRNVPLDHPLLAVARGLGVSLGEAHR
ncbi:ATP-dependent 6-phosphofructokinase [Ideonella sp. 4Y16]|uniref:ATP-dependent 6-phosphofructokinase n=1 Tax=Ideonella alba TaxID=2824118 RepID=A0A940YCN2_9BURK|nr:ATP-dependent 6-phosphofructokinase [Ideonella alba]MBQ0931718.1 ATP-dependent 6-phosphofructokinase [Ideonella alba]MBQ0944157.1 ATP-dependent 6-phosphofructokinase [Ideonella alba]